MWGGGSWSQADFICSSGFLNIWVDPPPSPLPPHSFILTMSAPPGTEGSRPVSTRDTVSHGLSLPTLPRSFKAVGFIRGPSLSACLSRDRGVGVLGKYSSLANVDRWLAGWDGNLCSWSHPYVKVAPNEEKWGRRKEEKDGLFYRHEKIYTILFLTLHLGYK